VQEIGVPSLIVLSREGIPRTRGLWIVGEQQLAPRFEAVFRFVQDHGSVDLVAFPSDRFALNV
jgi:hypothetical protein